jgi:type I restriction enzyme M protein
VWSSLSYAALGQLKNKILIPRYYDPELDAYIRRLKRTHSMVCLGDLVERGAVTIATGVEIGKMASGPGRIPFVRVALLVRAEQGQASA